MPSNTRPCVRRRSVLATVATLTIGALIWAPVPGLRSPNASAQVAAGYVITATPVVDVIDGQAISIRVAAPAGGLVLGGSARICRDGPAYATIEDTYPFLAGNCPNAGLSSSATEGGSINLSTLPDNGSAIGTLRVGTGRVQWGPASDPTKFELVCDASNPCRLVITLTDGTGNTRLDASTLVTFSDASPLASCGGAATGVLATTGPDRFIDTWARWTREECRAEKVKASTNAILTGEGLGLQTFAAGQADLAYSATGPAIPGKAPAKPRSSVSVPIGVNAVVIGALGGYPTTATDWPSGLPRPFTGLNVTPAEMASLFGQSTGFDTATITARNPQLATPLGPLAGVNLAPLAPASSDATSYLATRWFDTKAPDKWLTSTFALPGIPALAPRGIEDELSAANPPFAISVLNLYSARSNLKKAVAVSSTPAAGNYAITWVLTDLATAIQLDIPTVALQNSRGEFVQPTRASLEAALPAMERKGDGTIMPRGTTDAAGAYPLTFVEHAVAPTEPLLTADCKPRADSEKLLGTWLTYLTGAGQAQLSGLVPLTPELQQVAKASLAKVGAAKTTGACAKTAGPPPKGPPGLPNAPGGAGSGGGPLGGLGGPAPGSSGFGSSGLPGAGAGPAREGGAGARPTRSSDAKATARAKTAAESSPTRLPALVGIRSLRGSVGLGALAGLALMGAAAGSLSSGRRSRPRRQAP